MINFVFGVALGLLIAGVIIYFAIFHGGPHE